MGKQEDFVLRALEERDVRFVRLWFTDVLGYLKSVAIAPAELEGAFSEGIGFDGSAIEGFARVYEADMLAKPDPSTFQILPWRGEGPSTARMFCDIVMPDGSPSYADPRFVLKRTLSKAAENGFTFYTHPEIEFYLFKDTPTPGGEPVPVDRSGYFDHTAQSMGSDFRREAITMLEAMGISVEFSHHEGGPGQQEIDLRYADALSTADNIMTFRTVVREVALSQGIWATFMPKPFTTHPGSGMHTHVSLFEGDTQRVLRGRRGVPAVQDRPAVHRRHPQHAAEIAVVTNQWVNSYKRLMWGGEAPSYICWGHNNRSAMIRVPMYKPNKGQSTRMELRTIDSACNPYLAFAVILAAGMKGIEEGYELPARGRGRRLVAHRARAQVARHRPAAQDPVRGDRGRRELRAARRDARRARLRLLPAQQARRVGRVPHPGLRLRARPDAAAALSRAGAGPGRAVGSLRGHPTAAGRRARGPVPSRMDGGVAGRGRRRPRRTASLHRPAAAHRPVRAQRDAGARRGDGRLRRRRLRLARRRDAAGPGRRRGRHPGAGHLPGPPAGRRSRSAARSG